MSHEYSENQSIHLTKKSHIEELIKKVTQKVGISEAQAKSTIDTVVSFLKHKVPGGIGSQAESFLKGNLGSASSVIDGLKIRQAVCSVNVFNVCINAGITAGILFL